MTALGQKLTFALQNSCPLYPQKRTCAVQYPMSALGQKRTLLPHRNYSQGHGQILGRHLRSALLDYLHEISGWGIGSVERFLEVPPVQRQHFHVATRPHIGGAPCFFEDSY